eukprot:11177512-Lingulodinium_polyedra.AAC.1
MTSGLEWALQAGLSEVSSIVREHRVLSRVLRLALSAGQLDLAVCVSLELGFRGPARLELATKRNPRSPDFRGWTSPRRR